MYGSDYIWLWTVQKYDWMGRVVRKINTDGIVMMHACPGFSP